MQVVLVCCRASTSNITTVSSSSSVTTTVTNASFVSTSVSSTTSHSCAYNVSTVAGRISPSLIDDSSTSSAGLASTLATDKPVHYPKKVSVVIVLEGL